MSQAHKDRAYTAAWRDMRQAFVPGFHRCGFCCDPILKAEDVAIDHEVPIHQGGTHDRSNLRYAHSWCNSAGMSKPAPLRYSTPPQDSGVEAVPRLAMPEYLLREIERR